MLKISDERIERFLSDANEIAQRLGEHRKTYWEQIADLRLLNLEKANADLDQAIRGRECWRERAHKLEEERNTARQWGTNCAQERDSLKKYSQHQDNEINRLMNDQRRDNANLDQAIRERDCWRDDATRLEKTRERLRGVAEQLERERDAAREHRDSLLVRLDALKAKLLAVRDAV